MRSSSKKNYAEEEVRSVTTIVTTAHVVHIHLYTWWQVQESSGRFVYGNFKQSAEGWN